MPDPIDVLIKDISEHPLYPALLKKIKRTRPVTPDFDPNRDNTEEWKSKSSKKQGFDLALTILKIDGDKL